MKDLGSKFDSVQVCLEAAPTAFKIAYMLKGDKKTVGYGNADNRNGSKRGDRH